MKSAWVCLILVGGAAFGQTAASGWSPTRAAAYMDGRAAWWMTWPKSSRDHGTFCTSCHTAAPIALSRSALHGVLKETVPPATERKLLENTNHARPALE
jgi:hypothetical protein